MRTAYKTHIKILFSFFWEGGGGNIWHQLLGTSQRRSSCETDPWLLLNDQYRPGLHFASDRGIAPIWVPRYDRWLPGKPCVCLWALAGVSMVQTAPSALAITSDLRQRNRHDRAGRCACARATRHRVRGQGPGKQADDSWANFCSAFVPRVLDPWGMDSHRRLLLSCKTFPRPDLRQMRQEEGRSGSRSCQICMATFLPLYPAQDQCKPMVRRSRRPAYAPGRRSGALSIAWDATWCAAGWTSSLLRRT